MTKGMSALSWLQVFNSTISLDLPRRSYNLTFDRPSVRPFVTDGYQLFSRLAHKFFLIFGTKMQNGNSKNVTEPDFWKKISSAENAGNMPEKQVFWHFLGISSFVFPDFLHQNGY